MYIYHEKLKAGKFQHVEHFNNYILLTVYFGQNTQKLIIIYSTYVNN